ncbi:metallophosphoesterase, partial [Patescibacteria group bacterium AH-259-L05]|nr:metallophosphoesterase [Patescibacteria group bacterium AH-259-L05]
MVLHQGDFDYEDSPDLWDEQITNVLGHDFPYFASVGNHDVDKWLEYKQKLSARLNKIDKTECYGDLGVNSACTYKSIFFILSGVGTLGTDHTNYIKEQLASTDAAWRICSWHKNQRLMQVGDKKDEVGWEPYEECRKGGALIATGHEHSYSRTHLMDNFKTQSIASTDNTLIIQKGRTFAFVSGLGGKSIRKQNDVLARKPWWAAIYTADQDADYGALFCIFNHGGVTNKAYCYFKDINGAIADEFDIISTVE